MSTQTATTEERLKAVLSKIMGPAFLPDAPFDASAMLAGTLELDSLDLLELAMGIEEEFLIDLTDADVDAFRIEAGRDVHGKTLGDLIALVDQKVAAARA